MSSNFVITMSQAGKCPRALWAARNKIEGIPAPSWLSEAAEEGNLHEGAIKKKLIAKGWEIEEGGECKICKNGRKGIHVEFTYKGIFFVGHTDGRATKDKKRVLECKSMSQFEFDRWMKDRWEAFPDYAAQFTCYMRAENNYSGLYAVKNRNNGYIDIMPIEGPPADFNEMMKQIVQSTASDMPVIEADFGTFRCKRCNYKKLCVKTKDDMVIQNEVELDEACGLWRDGSKEIESGEAKVKQANSVFLEHLTAMQLDKCIYNELSITKVVRNNNLYTKKILEELFTKKQLLPALNNKPIAPYVTITDLKKEA